MLDAIVWPIIVLAKMKKCTVTVAILAHIMSGYARYHTGKQSPPSELDQYIHNRPSQQTL